LVVVNCSTTGGSTQKGGGRSVFDCTGGGKTIFDAGSEPGKERYIHVC